MKTLVMFLLGLMLIPVVSAVMRPVALSPLTERSIHSGQDADYDLTFSVAAPIAQYWLLVEITGSGTTNATGATIYDSGTVVSVKASPGAGWMFAYWLRNGTNEGLANPYTLVTDDNINLTPVFMRASAQWSLTVQTDKPYYYVGDRVHVSGILTYNGYHVAGADVSVVVRLSGSTGLPYHLNTTTTDPDGTYNDCFPVAGPKAVLGEWMVNVSATVDNMTSSNWTTFHLINAIYIRAGGEVEPAEAPISRNGEVYCLTGNISGNATNGIVIERNDTILDGAGFTVNGTSLINSNGINLTGVDNVTVKNISVKSFHDGVYEYGCSNSHIAETNLSSNDNGIFCQYSNNNTIEGNNITKNAYAGIWLDLSQYNNISGNTLANNNIASNLVGGIYLQDFSSYNNVVDNNLVNNTWYGIYIQNSFSNNVFHNNFVNNTFQAFVDPDSPHNVWDDGYPSGGNYWSDYNGTDLHSDTYQNETGSDGMGDIPYIIDSSNQDNYPLMNPWVAFENQTIYIRADGSVNPQSAPIQRKGDSYTLTGNVTSDADGIVIERDNTVVDGAGHFIQGNVQNLGVGIILESVQDVTIKNSSIVGGIYGNSAPNTTLCENSIDSCNLWQGGNNTIYENNITSLSLRYTSYPCSVFGNNITGLVDLFDSSFNVITGNRIETNGDGIRLTGSSGNTISGNQITAINGSGIVLQVFKSFTGGSNNNTISANNIAVSNGSGIWLGGSSNNTILDNVLNVQDGNGLLLTWDTNDHDWVFPSTNNTLQGNDITAFNQFGVQLINSSGNVICHNNFLSTQQAASANSSNTWDSGYPSGGNYWSDYSDSDLYRGPYQNLSGSDGIGDMLHAIDANNTDHYPLMKPYPWAAHDIGITNVATSKNVVGQGCSASTNMMIFNYGNETEADNVTIYANQTIIGEVQNISLTISNFTIVAFTWNTTGFAKGNYSISAYAWPVQGETDTADNNARGGWIVVSMVGDLTGGSSNPWDFVPDGKVDGKDITIVATCFGSTPGANRPSPWNSNCDVNNDCKIDGKDIVMVALHYGQADP